MVEETTPLMNILISWFPMLLLIWAWWYFITRIANAVQDVASALRDVATAIAARSQAHNDESTLRAD